MQTWSSVSANSDAPFGSWADDLASAFVRLEPSKLSADPFKGRIRQAVAKDFQVSRVDATAHRVSRLDEHIRLASRDTCFLNLQISGPGLTRQRMQERVARPGDIVLVDTTEPFQIEHSDRFSLYSIAVSRKLVPDVLFESRLISLSANALGREISQALLGHAHLLLEAQRVGLAVPATLGQHMLELISFAQDSVSGTGKFELTQSAQLDLIRKHMTRNFRDEGLSARTIARAVGLSPRYVHRLFETTGKTVSEHINLLRIEACAIDLCRSADKTETIAAIAYRNGFRDISYFNRRFRQAFGETPTDYRRRHAYAEFGMSAS